MQSVYTTANLWVRIPLRRGVLDTTLCDKVCQCLATGRWFSPLTPVSSTYKTDRHEITEILLKVALNTINHKLTKQKHLKTSNSSAIVSICNTYSFSYVIYIWKSLYQFIHPCLENIYKQLSDLVCQVQCNIIIEV